MLNCRSNLGNEQKTMRKGITDNGCAGFIPAFFHSRKHLKEVSFGECIWHFLAVQLQL